MAMGHGKMRGKLRGWISDGSKVIQRNGDKAVNILLPEPMDSQS